MELSSDAQMIRYLLGELSDEEKTRFEETYFSDDRVFEALQIVETELIDSYVRGALSPIERQQFENCYLNSPERLKKLETARCLTTALAEASSYKSDLPPSSSVLKSILHSFMTLSVIGRIGYAAATIAVGFAIVMIIQNRKLRFEVGRLGAEMASHPKTNQDLELQAAQSKESAGPRTPNEPGKEIEQPQSLIASITLMPGLSRGTQSRANNELVVPLTARWIVLNLRLETDEYPAGYNAIVETANGDEVQRTDRIKSRAGIGGERFVEVQLPAELLGGDSYIVRLVGVTARRGEEEADDYSFQVIRR